MGKNHSESAIIPIWATLAGLAAFASANAMARAFVFAMTLKSSAFLDEHLDADACKSDTY